MENCPCSCPCTDGFSPGSVVFLTLKSNMSKFQFDLEFEGHKFVKHNIVDLMLATFENFFSFTIFRFYILKY